MWSRPALSSRHDGKTEVKPVIGTLAVWPELDNSFLRVGLEVRFAESLDALAAAVETGNAVAAVVDTRSGERWPVDLAELAVRRLGQTAPLLLLCDTANDVAVIDVRVGGLAVAVAVRDETSAAEIVAILRGELARRGAKGGSAERTLPDALSTHS
jgi:hypothetical protein